MMIRN